MFYIVIFAVIFAADMWTKFLAAERLLPIGTLPLWDGVFHLTYVENRGAAFGMLQNGRMFFIVATVLVLVLAAIVLRKYYKESQLFKLALAFFTAGAVGNLADRIFRGYVVDFLDFRLINFPVFNIADIFVCVGAILIAVFILFFEDASCKKESEENEA